MGDIFTPRFLPRDGRNSSFPMGIDQRNGTPIFRSFLHYDEFIDRNVGRKCHSDAALQTIVESRITHSSNCWSYKSDLQHAIRQREIVAFDEKRFEGIYAIG